MGFFERLRERGSAADYQGLLERIPYARFLGITVRSANPDDVLARATITKHGRRVANVRVEAWQGSRERLVAAAHGHFLMPSIPGADIAE